MSLLEGWMCYVICRDFGSFSGRSVQPFAQERENFLNRLENNHAAFFIYLQQIQ